MFKACETGLQGENLSNYSLFRFHPYLVISWFYLSNYFDGVYGGRIFQYSPFQLGKTLDSEGFGPAKARKGQYFATHTGDKGGPTVIE